MSVNPEMFDTPEAIATARPSFIIELDAPHDIAKQLAVDELWLLHRPLLREAAIGEVKRAARAADGSVWERLTDKQVCGYFHFDQDTETAIDKDHEIARINVRRAQPLSSEAAQEEAFNLRIRRLEIFVERARLAKGIGRTSLAGSE